jgi:hypothetical protein
MGWTRDVSTRTRAVPLPVAVRKKLDTLTGSMSTSFLARLKIDIKIHELIINVLHSLIRTQVDFKLALDCSI